MPVPPASTADFMGGRTRFAMLELLSEIAPRSLPRADGRRFVRRGLFRCDCGGSIEADLRNVRRGLTRSCGCHSGRQFAGEPTVRERLARRRFASQFYEDRP